WQAYDNGGTIAVNAGFVSLSRPSLGQTFPYVYLKPSVIPSTDPFAIKVGIQYTGVTISGTGIGVSDKLVPNGTSGSIISPVDYLLWQDTLYGFRLEAYPGDSSKIVYRVPPPDLNYHNVEFIWYDNYDEYYVDRQFVNSTTHILGMARPTVVWFGNPLIPGPDNVWTSFKIDYLEVDASAATNTPTSTPTATSSATDTPTNTPTDTPTNTATPTATSTSTNTPTDTPTPTNTATPAATPCAIVPALPRLIAPANGATASTRKVFLDWSEARCATRYEVQVKRGPSSATLIDGQTNLTVSQYTTITLPPGITYYWRARACDLKGGSAWSAYWRFTVSTRAAFDIAPGDWALAPFLWLDH
ncbi:MAG: hypothetical protein WCF84_25225, partial [Anaerolineae bacterium]